MNSVEKGLGEVVLQSLMICVGANIDRTKSGRFR